MNDSIQSQIIDDNIAKLGGSLWVVVSKKICLYIFD